jgi:hypothetical protein
MKRRYTIIDTKRKTGTGVSSGQITIKNKQMKFKYILLVFIPCIIAWSCKKQDLHLYNSDIAGIYFNKKITTIASTILIDSTSLSFANGHGSTMDSILRIPVMALGKLKDYPRTFKVSADPVSTAIEGKHYEIDHSNAVVNAGAAESYVSVKFKRTADMGNSKFRLILKLEENEHFKPYIEKQKQNAGSLLIVPCDRFTIIVDDILTEPNSWKYLRSQYVGDYSAKKYKYINSLLGWTPVDWTVGWVNNIPPPYSPIQNSILPGAMAFVRDTLQALANAGTPMLDENGLGMQLSNTYRVVY